MFLFIMFNIVVFLLFLLFVLYGGVFGKVFWTLAFIGFTYFNVFIKYPEILENERQKTIVREISQEKLKDCEILIPRDNIVVYHCPEYTTTETSIRVGKGVRTETVTINNK